MEDCIINKVIDQKNPHEGIQEPRYIDASMKMRFVRQIVRKKGDGTFKDRKMLLIQFKFHLLKNILYIWIGGALNPSSNLTDTKGVKLTRDSIAYCTSGLVDRNKGSVLSYLHKAIKSLNQLMMIEDSLLSTDFQEHLKERIFYIDVGNLPKIKAEQYLRDVMMSYRNKLVYDANTGEIRDDKKHMSMMEDFWLPRREGGRGTEITHFLVVKTLVRLLILTISRRNFIDH